MFQNSKPFAHSWRTYVRIHSNPTRDSLINAQCVHSDLGDGDIQVKYNLKNLVTANNFIYIKLKKGMYGLKQAAILAYNNLINNLKDDGYSPIKLTDSYWKHKKCPTVFCLCIDDFGIKYCKKNDLNYLNSTLLKFYKISISLVGLWPLFMSR